MQKSELITRYAQACELSRPEAAAAVNTLLELISEALEQGESVRLSGFGKFEVRPRAARTVREPLKKTVMCIGEYKTVAFHVSNGLKKRINQE